MGRRTVLLCTEDKRYLDAFADYCARNEGSRISIKTFNTKEALDRYEKSNSVDLVLIDAGFLNGGKLSYNSKIAILSEEKYVDRDTYIYVYKFQRIDIIIKQIYQIFADTPECEIYKCSGGKKCNITGVFSPCFPAQREQYARELAEVYANTDNVLYINLAELTEHDFDGGEGVSELIYYLHESNKPVSYRLLTMLKEEEGYKSIAGVKHYRDLYGITSGDADRLFECIDTLDEFDRIVIDAGFLGDSVYEILAHCNEIYMPVSDERSLRLKHLLKDMQACGEERLINEIKVIQLPEWWDMRKDMRNKWVSHEK